MKLMIFSVTKAANNNPLGANMPNIMVLPLCKICGILFVLWSLLTSFVRQSAIGVPMRYVGTNDANVLLYSAYLCCIG